MKKGLFVILLISLFVSKSYSQRGELAIGLGGGYANLYESALFGINVDYNLLDHVQLSFSEMINPSVKLEDDKLGMYATNLDLRFFVIHMQDWATGPGIGGQYLIERGKDNPLLDDERWGFNLGWHFRGNITDELRILGGWKWTSLQEDDDNHFFYLGLSYAFELY